MQTIMIRLVGAAAASVLVATLGSCGRNSLPDADDDVEIATLTESYPSQQADAQAAAAASPLEVIGDVVPPQIVATPDLDAVWRRGGYVQGFCLVRVTVTEAGDVREVELVKPEGSSELHQALTSAFRTMKFTPATLDGEPVPVYWNMSVNHCPVPPPQSAG